MQQLYNVNGLIFWGEKEINARKIVESHLVQAVKDRLKAENRAWEFFQMEAPLLTPFDKINKGYSASDVFVTNHSVFPAEYPLDEALEAGVPVVRPGDQVELVLRPETTMGSYAYARYLLNPHNEQKVRMPLVVWQHGKSFRREQDQPSKLMRLKEFYQLEFQCIYSLSTKNEYAGALIPAVAGALSQLVGGVRIVPSDRLPDYSEETTDIEHIESGMELCSCSKRKDFENAKVIEIAVGTDRVVKHFLGV